MRTQYILAVSLAVLIAIAGVRFVTTNSRSFSIEKFFTRSDDLTPAQSLLLGGTIDINTADQKTFEVLSHIGPKLAARIVEDRNVNGPFRSVYDLRRVHGVGRATIERNLSYIAVK
jgi:competence ComEA-like helix-hairpin-helix protein